MTLEVKQRKLLRTLAHSRKPVVMVGTAGLSDAVLAEVESALDAHELIKVRIRAEDRAARDVIVDRILDATGAQQVQRVGHVLTIFRRNPGNPRIEL